MSIYSRDESSADSSESSESSEDGEKSFDRFVLPERPRAERKTEDGLKRERIRQRSQQRRLSKKTQNLAIDRYRRFFDDETVLLQYGDRNVTIDETMPPSYVGRTFWKSIEKETLFAFLPQIGCRDLPALSTAVGSKSEVEIAVYLRQLEAGLGEAAAVGHDKDHLGDFDHPAAFDITERCENELQSLADYLVVTEAWQAQQEAMAKHGKHWLIDSELAIQIEKEYQRESNKAMTADIPAGVDSRVTAEVEEQGPQEPTSFFQAQQFAGVPGVEGEDETGESDGLKLCDASRLLNPSMLLQLSETVFMNGPLGTGQNWRDHLTKDQAVDGPAMLRTVLDELYSLTVSITSRIVQIANYQAMTRMRAMDTRHSRIPDASITLHDVQIACDMLKLPTDSKQFWAKAARRNRLDVFTNKRKYEDGRRTTKNGVKLTHAEVEAELQGLLLDKDTMPFDEVVAVGNDDDCDVSLSSDQWTIESFDTSDADLEESIDKGINGEFKEELKGGSDFSSSGEADACESVEESSDSRRENRAIEKALEETDDRHSGIEEGRIWHEVIEGSEDPYTPNTDASFDTMITYKRPFDSSDRAWHAATDHKAYWEVYDQPIRDEQFQEMARRGQAGRKRRKTIRAKALKLLAHEWETDE